MVSFELSVTLVWDGLFVLMYGILESLITYRKSLSCFKSWMPDFILTDSLVFVSSKFVDFFDSYYIPLTGSSLLLCVA